MKFYSKHTNITATSSYIPKTFTCILDNAGEVLIHKNIKVNSRH